MKYQLCIIQHFKPSLGSGLFLSLRTNKTPCICICPVVPNLYLKRDELGYSPFKNMQIYRVNLQQQQQQHKGQFLIAYIFTLHLGVETCESRPVLHRKFQILRSDGGPSFDCTIATRFPVPANEKHSHNTMLPPPCFTE